MRFLMKSDIERMGPEILAFLIDRDALQFEDVREILQLSGQNKKCMQIADLLVKTISNRYALRKVSEEESHGKLESYLLDHGFSKEEAAVLIKKGIESLTKFLEDDYEEYTNKVS